ncbi:MAG TPA: HDIG domain-containing protein [Desulfobacterales bacterium]|nr:HDIG domain-containing protein [Desulfobacterales bacterium]
MIPSPEECLLLMSEYGMLDNIRAHSRVVARIADFIGRGLIADGVGLNLKLIVSAALLHDIGKTACLNNGRDHSRLGAEICRRHNFQELAPLVRQHVILQGTLPPEVDERLIVYYADKRVNHDQIVGLPARLAYIIERYGQNNPRRCQAINDNFKQAFIIEEMIFRHLPIKPEELSTMDLT